MNFSFLTYVFERIFYLCWKGLICMQKNLNSKNSLLSGFFQASYMQELQNQLKQTLSQSLLYPQDAEWLAENFEAIFQRANNVVGASQSTAVRVSHHEDEVILQNTQKLLVLEWRDVWQEKDAQNRSLEILAKNLTKWSVYSA